MSEVERIKKICCQEMGLPYAHLTTSRKRPIPEIKQLITHFLTYKLKMTRNQVACEINLNYATVIHNLKVTFDPIILASIEKKINDPLYVPFVYKCQRNYRTAAISVDKKKKLKKIKEVPEKLYGRSLKDIDKEIEVLSKKMEEAEYNDVITLSRRIDVLTIRRQNIIKPLR